MSRKKILVADDDQSILDVLGIILSEMGGYETVLVNDATNLANRVAGLMPDLVLLDLSMSGFDGKEICEELKQNTVTSSIPVLIFSANRDIQIIAQESGADGFLEKPFEMPALLEKVEALIA